MLVAAGATLVLAAGAAHGDLPERGEAALRFVASHEAYALVHFVSILGACCGRSGCRAIRSCSKIRALVWLPAGPVVRRSSAPAS